MRFCEPNLR